MNTFQNCRNTSDAIPLYLPQDLYLKPIARIHISVLLPHKIETGKSISNWEIMDKLRQIIKPEEFIVLKVVKNTLEFIRFEAEIEDKAKLFRILALVDARTIKLAAFADKIVKIRATEAKSEFPTRHAWDSFFRDAKNMDEMKPGERPDTIHIANLPISWFVQSQHMLKEGVKPSQKIFHRLFEKFGHIRHVDIPICDPYRSKMKEHINGMKTFTFDQEILFEGYVQFKDYGGFTRGMDALRGMNLLRKEGNDNAKTINIKVDFDKTKHLSDASIRRRQIVRERLISKDRDREEKEKQEKNKVNHEEEQKRLQETQQQDEKEKRRRDREEKRKARHFAQLKLIETEELKKKIAKEEKKLLKAQRKLEAIRIIEELFKRIELKKKKDEKAAQSKRDKYSNKNELTKFKIEKELKVKEQRDKLNKALEGHVVLNSILGNDENKNTTSESSSDSDSDDDKKHKKKKKKEKKKSKSRKDKTENVAGPSTSYPLDPHNPLSIPDPNWYVPPAGMYPYPPMYRPHLPPGYYPPPVPISRGRAMDRSANGAPGSSRGQYPRRRGAFNPYWGRGFRGRRGGMMPHYPIEMEQEYMKYFQKFLKEDHDDRDRRSYSRSRTRTRSSSYDRNRFRKRSRKQSRSSRSRSRSRTRSRSRSRSNYRSRRSKSRSRSRSKSRRRSRSRSYNRSRSRSRSRSGTKSKSNKPREKSAKSRKSRTRTRSKSRSKSRSRSQNKSKNTSNGKEKNSEKPKSRSPSYQSIDSSKFISPSRLRSKRSRSKSWSLPRNSSKKRSSWSKSPSPVKT